ncbi:D-alanyl-D-alanine carboxypeptidase [Alkalihalobacillus trypoxylicola]|uniref:D-alanyl-D-alanine carboxypeptidase n=2 Tax=Alkalihalobacillus trypoxylicola TaxID=519424 RepID=A0A161P4N9_9BACI|nr:D-alanyl-D-alanine carboxypeptidase [Alkalihalobacillus trypoxylicola]
MEMIIWIIGIAVISLILILGTGIYMFKKKIKKDNPEYILQFVKEHLESDKVALSINYNDQEWVNINSKNLLPLASTVKIIVAIEYARQASKGQINSLQKVSLDELNTFYIPKTDGGAHEAWIASLDDGKGMETVFLSDVAKGMITYSSNANTEYLMQLLGLENINTVLVDLNISNHEPLYPLVSAMFIPTQLLNEKNVTRQELLKLLENMDISEYRKRAINIHKKWISQPPTDQDKKQILKNLDLNIQRIWSDRLPRSTTATYVDIMDNLNSKTYFDDDIYKYLEPVMEQLMSHPTNREWLMHAGEKGGSTAFILTTAMYATDKEGNQTEMAFFTNDLTSLEQTKLSRNLNGFKLKFLKDTEFRNRMTNELAIIKK